MSIPIARICFYRRIEAVRTCTHNKCFYKENQKKYCSTADLLKAYVSLLVGYFTILSLVIRLF